MRIFHIIAPDVWAEAVKCGEYRPASVWTEGFVHFSFADQVAGTANLAYRDEPDLVVVEVESDRVDAELKVEDSYRGGTEFPHVYGAIPPESAVAIHPLRRATDGSWTFSVTSDGAAAPASPDR
jgi:uncharacterized protein (DUF952 family)